MEGPQERSKNKVEDTPIFGLRADAGGYASEYMAEISKQNAIIKDAGNLLEKIRYSSSLKPEAVSKVIQIQNDRIAKAKAKIAKITGKNEEEITKHIQ